MESLYAESVHSCICRRADLCSSYAADRPVQETASAWQERLTMGLRDVEAALDSSWERALETVRGSFVPDEVRIVNQQDKDCTEHLISWAHAVS